MKKIAPLLNLVLCFLACEEIIEVKDISKEAITILAPTNNTVLDKVAVVFSWEPVELAETYHIQVATPNFENAQQIVKDSTLTETRFSTTLSTKTYEWRVRAVNSEYTTDYNTNGFLIEE